MAVLRSNRCTAALITCAAVLFLPGAVRAEGWQVTIFGGGAASGQLFKAKAQATRTWLTPDGRTLEGTELRAELGESVAGGLRVGRRIDERLWLRAGVSFADLDVTGNHRTAIEAEIASLYDQAFVVATSLTAAYELFPTGNTVYFLGGLGFSTFSFEPRELGKLDQTQASVVLGAGYRLRAVESLHIDFEVSDTIQNVDLDEEQVRLSPDEFDGASVVHLWQFTAGWTFGF